MTGIETGFYNHLAGLEMIDHNLLFVVVREIIFLGCERVTGGYTSQMGKKQIIRQCAHRQKNKTTEYTISASKRNGSL